MAAVYARFVDDRWMWNLWQKTSIALARRGSLPANSSSRFEMQSSSRTSTPSSSRTSMDLDRSLDNNAGNSADPPQSPHLSHNALNQGYYGRFFVETKKLGRGYRGSVFLCQHILDGIHLGEYAIKKVAVGDNHDWLVQMLREVHLLERLHHPNIVSYKHAWLENHQLHKFGPEVTCLFILMECANGGNLEEYIERSAADLHTPAEGEGATGEGRDQETAKPISVRERLLQTRRQHKQQQQQQHHQHQHQHHLHDPFHKPMSGTLGGNGTPGGQERVNTLPQRHYLSITEIWSFFFDICEGLAHLHRLGIIHRDLKPPNLLLSYSNSQVKGSKGERPRILITDFGECEVLDQAAKRNRTGATGTLEFLAPELLTVDSEGRYTDEFSFKGDMWSLGMVLYYLCYSRLPYSQIEDVDILKDEIREFRSITIPADESEGGRVIPDELKILIRVLLSTDKAKRPSCEDILTTLSHQRDRMMHGDMDSPTTPIRASTDGPAFTDSSDLDARDVET
ncbi:putative serine/threonine-protein kinase iks1 [Mortierella alpina]|uniref:non-specific serine/threonine protein kinase n=1 Tax=Mortierella alpina TaxID=64518 RepID=A0A9P6J916_MORAP|nr:putative serine/threonine-protein kinase iks1 [Mortierella alpina]